jgi:hypothetical protein
MVPHIKKLLGGIKKQRSLIVTFSWIQVTLIFQLDEPSISQYLLYRSSSYSFRRKTIRKLFFFEFGNCKKFK